MNREPAPSSQQSEKPTCGNCCNAIKSTRAVGRITCTALPPAIVARPGGMGTNVYPELEAGKLGCTVLWNVSASLFHILAQAVTLASQPASNDSGQETSDNGTSAAPGIAGP